MSRYTDTNTTEQIILADVIAKLPDCWASFSVIERDILGALSGIIHPEDRNNVFSMVSSLLNHDYKWQSRFATVAHKFILRVESEIKEVEEREFKNLVAEETKRQRAQYKELKKVNKALRVKIHELQTQKKEKPPGYDVKSKLDNGLAAPRVERRRLEVGSPEWVRESKRLDKELDDYRAQPFESRKVRVPGRVTVEFKKDRRYCYGGVVE